MPCQVRLARKAAATAFAEVVSLLIVNDLVDVAIVLSHECLVAMSASIRAVIFMVAHMCLKCKVAGELPRAELAMPFRRMLLSGGTFLHQGAMRLDSATLGAVGET